MKLDEAKQQFVEAWGTLGTNWGINRTMAQIHALLLVSDEPLSTDEIMDKLDISRGNANMNLRALIDWGLAERKVKLGERMEFFVGEKDIWKVAVRIIRERRKREIDPMRATLRNLTLIDDKDDKKEEYQKFIKLVKDIDAFAESTDKIADKMILADRNWFYGTLMKLMIK
ncbi:MAG TPA: MarR family transcriptional regulator [Chitinophagales bacterium]|nr:MarR family transcriptional regulator [Chitinophagales bacterium]